MSIKMKCHSPDEIFQMATLHSFYQQRLLAARSFAEACPTNKSELYLAIEEAMAEPAFGQGIYWSPTGGSGSQLLFYPTAIEENFFQRDLLLPYLQQAQIFTPETRALNLFGSTMMYRSAEIFNYFCEKSGATVLPVSSVCRDQEALEIALRFGANTIMGNPSRLLQFARYVLQAKPGDGFKLEHVIFGGEALAAHKMQYLNKAFGAERLSAVFGSAEGGIWAFKSADMALGKYFYPRKLMHLEIVECDHESFGSMVLTNLVRSRNPLLRYDCGDRARFCQGEETDELGCFILAGRVEGSFQLGGEYYELADFTKLLASRPDILLDYQIELSCDHSSKLDQLHFSLVFDSASKIKEEVADNYKFVKQAIENWINRDDNLFILTIALVEMGDLTRSATAQKVVRICDKR